MRQLTKQDDIKVMLADLETVSIAFQSVYSRFCEKSLGSMMEQIIDEVCFLMTDEEKIACTTWQEEHPDMDIVDWIKGEDQ